MRIKKAILTGGGRATRLHPITTTINKHLLPLANKPMIFHAIEKAVEAGVTDIFVNINPGETELQKAIGDGGHWGINVVFFEQTGGPQGIAHVVNEAKKFIGDDPFLFYLSDNVLLGDLKEMFDEFETTGVDCMLALSEVPDSRSFGVPVFGENNILTDVLEKPQDPPNNFAVTGIYMYGPKIFFDAFEKIEKSARGEYEISSIHSQFLKDGKNVGYKEITGWWKDTGKPEDLLIANRLLLEQLEIEKVPSGVTIDPTAVIDGEVHIGIGARIDKGVRIKGPVLIGENCVIEDAEIGPNVTLSQGCSVKGASIKDSIILENTEIHAPMRIRDSIIGKNVRLIKQEGGPEGHQMIVGDKTVIEM
ncbi:MAG: glucose-1-phosphate thymidylyltransferase [Candidatus Magasanikbacteria bacterium CG_4_9_14_0_2_um_filter_42_11]|uniref:Glucose-1-phosphate thymidylyltransferase n=1 Tax=Candidatus Magasanikbacteria bacterium CG_4_9_14_0_2_um_filter_42_11 TaxID=1974643 RepID=A0A2M8F9P9_9BACT|nr:MAG: glucose-1-phosphate thymidylyltransferase [Candidatus Magasanikbacteria bacterium CG_4_10_14_0_8_um_filter_42_12]PJC52457.1 MAG: glucose-1-phosphate thymidylyltransferase [Candidatus Magasanikbacteria bacterium CG_4_9_14_0_2_um_filter_42_11]